MSKFYLHSHSRIHSEYGTSDARTCAIPMIMRNTNEMLPSKCIDYSCSHIAADRDRQRYFFTFKHAASFSCHFSIPMCRVDVTIFSGFRWVCSIYICLLNASTASFFSFLFSVFRFFVVTSLILMMRVAEMRTLQQTSVRFCSPENAHGPSAVVSHTKRNETKKNTR